MTTTNILSTVFNTLYLTILAAYLLSGLNVVELPYQEYILWIGLCHLLATPLLLIWNMLFIKGIRKKLMLISTPLILFVCMLFFVHSFLNASI